MKSLNPRHRHTLSGQVTIALYRITQAIEYLLRDRGKRAQLSPAQIQALLFLKHARSTAHTVSGLAGRLGVTLATTSGVVDALESKQLLRREQMEEDQRVVRLLLTPEGERKAAELEDVLDEVEAAIASLPEDEQAVLKRATQAIVRRLQLAGYVKVYDMCWNCQFFRRDAHPHDPRGPHHCAFIDAPLPEAETYCDCPDFVPAEFEEEVMPGS